jgi:hypothetical protein
MGWNMGTKLKESILLIAQLKHKRSKGSGFMSRLTSVWLFSYLLGDIEGRLQCM